MKSWQIEEFNINENLALVSGIELLRVRADFNDASNNQFYLNNNSLNIPLSLQIQTQEINGVSFFGSLGIYASYLYNSKIEQISSDNEIEENNLGFNFGAQINLGVKLKINEKFNFRLGLKSKSDLFESYKSNNQSFILTEVYTFQIGLGFNLWKLY